MSEPLEPGAPAPRSGGPRTRGHWIALAIAGAIALGFAIDATLLSPDPRGVGTHEQLGLPPCMTMELWGVPCPGCGVTTSVTLASHGRLVDSFLTQPFGLALWLAAVAFVVGAVIAHAAGVDLGILARRFQASRAGGKVVGVAVALAGAAWIYKLVVTR